jgi:hypothetical protein
MGTVIDAGDLGEYEGMRPTIKDVSKRAKTIHRHFPGHGYSDLVLMRPDKGLSQEQILKLRRALTTRAYDPYSVPMGLRATLKELFVPKIKPLAKNLPGSCSGTMCSALPGEAMAEAGILKNIAKGKAPQEVLPADFLRAGSGYSPVGAITRQQRALSPVSRAIYPYLSRAGLGLGIGGAIYGAYKDPETTAGILGGLATPALARGLSTKILQKTKQYNKDQAMVAVGNQLPKMKRLLMENFTPDPEMSPELLRKLKIRLGTRTLPLAVLGGLGSFLAARKVRGMFSEKDKK